MSRSFVAAILLATSASAAELPPATPLVAGPGDQTDPSLSFNAIAYLGTTARGTEVFLRSLAPGALASQLTNDSVDQGAPHLAGNRLAFRSPNLVEVRDFMGGGFSIPLDDGGFLGPTALSETLVAWVEAGRLTGTDVGWLRLGDPTATPTVLRDAGDQHSLSVAGDWLAYVDGASVRLVNTAAGTVQSFDVPGAPQDVSIWTPGGAPRIAVLAIPTGGDGTRESIYVIDSATGASLGALETAGVKVHPRLYGDWVGFEASDDQLKPQVTLWHFTDPSATPWLFLPSPTGSWQKLHDLVVTNDQVQVVWSDDSSGDFDIYMFEAPMQDVLAPRTASKPATCDSSEPPLGQFDLSRETSGPTSGGTLFTANEPTRVLVCIEAQGVTSGWIGVGSEVVAAPGDFGKGSQAREVRLTVAAGEGRVGAVIGGDPGATLRVRVFADADGGGNGNGGSDSGTCAASGGCPPGPPGLAKSSGLSCATATGFGPLAALLLPAGLLLAPRRRSRR
ncbi:MAG TPA: hypothetical protein VLT47_09310 [Anaeromyxobacteraceae bacterium]|nr:hypothetical protein [Anaeromyxobacteraceae bacterium]